MSACRKTPDTYSRKALGMSATAMKPKTSRTWNFDPIKPRRRSKITLARLRPTRNSIRPSSRKLRLKSEMTARFETSEVWRVSGGNSVCANTNASKVAPATPTAISSRRRRLRSASRCGLTDFFAANSSTPHQRKQQGRGDADKNAGGKREIEAEVAAAEVDVAGQPAYIWRRRQSPQRQSHDHDRDTGEDQAFSYRRHRRADSAPIVLDGRPLQYPAAPPCPAELCVGVRVRFGAGGLARRERLLDDFLRDRRRRLLVMREVLLERAAARRDRAQVGCVLQHLRHRHLRLDHLAMALAVHPEHFAAARVQIANHVAHAFIGTRNFDRDDRFENDRFGLFQRCLEAHRGCDLKRHVRRIDIVIAAVEYGDLDVHHRIAGQMSFDQRVAHALFDRRNEVARDHAAHDVVDELEAFAARVRLDLEPAIAVLPAAARLTLVLALRFGASLDGFLVRNFGRLKLDVHVEFPAQLLDGDFDMHLAGARQNDVVGLRIAMHFQREVL